MAIYFSRSDFDALDPKMAASKDSRVIAARKSVVDRKFKTLHEECLKEFFKKNGLYAHWLANKGYLTSVYWPFGEANHFNVQYIRMGYAKSEALIKEMFERASSKKDASFYYATQLQIGINYNTWWVELYVDKNAWIEQSNIIAKITSSIKVKQQFATLLQEAQVKGFNLEIEEFDRSYSLNCFTDANLFIDYLIYISNKKCSYKIIICKNFGRDFDPVINIKDFTKSEFTALLQLYKFMAWSPDNNYIKI